MSINGRKNAKGFINYNTVDQHYSGLRQPKACFPGMSQSQLVRSAEIVNIHVVLVSISLITSDWQSCSDAKGQPFTEHFSKIDLCVIARTNPL